MGQGRHAALPRPRGLRDGGCAAHQEQEPAQHKLWIWCCNATLSVAMAQSSSYGAFGFSNFSQSSNRGLISGFLTSRIQAPERFGKRQILPLPRSQAALSRLQCNAGRLGSCANTAFGSTLARQMPLSPRRTERLRRRSHQLDKSCFNSQRFRHCPFRVTPRLHCRTPCRRAGVKGLYQTLAGASELARVLRSSGGTRQDREPRPAVGRRRAHPFDSSTSCGEGR